MCLEGADFPIAFIAGTAARGRSGYGVSLFTKEDKEIPKFGVSESLHTPLCATASGVLAALRTARKLNLRHINLAFQWSDITDYLEDREYPDEPGTKGLFRKIYKSPVKFSVVDYTGCCGISVFVWNLARAASGTLSLSPNPINDNLYKNGVIGVTISAFIRKSADGVRLGAYGFYYEKDLLDDWGRKMNEAGVILDPGCEFDVCVRALNIALFATIQSKHYEVRIKTASRPIHLLIEDFKKTGLESYKSVNGIDGLKKTIKHFDRSSIEIEYIPDYRNEGIREAYLFTLNEFKLREDSMYWKNGVRKVYTDGSCWKNGQKGAVAGCGVFWGLGDSRNACFTIYGKQTNIRAEYIAVIGALEDMNSTKQVIICTDCEVLVNSINEYLPIWKRNGWKTSKGGPVENQDLVMKIDELMGKMEYIKFEWVPGHTGHEGNEGADQLAKKAVRMAMGLE